MDDFDRALMANPKFVVTMEKLAHALETTEIDWDKIKKVDFDEWFKEARQAEYMARRRNT